MITNALDENTFEVLIYDWVNLHEDYVCGYVKIDRNADEDSDLKYWLFYPVGSTTPINAGDMRMIGEFTAKLNS